LVENVGADLRVCPNARVNYWGTPLTPRSFQEKIPWKGTSFLNSLSLRRGEGQGEGESSDLTPAGEVSIPLESPNIPVIV